MREIECEDPKLRPIMGYGMPVMAGPLITRGGITCYQIRFREKNGSLGELKFIPAERMVINDPGYYAFGIDFWRMGYKVTIAGREDNVGFLWPLDREELARQNPAAARNYESLLGFFNNYYNNIERLARENSTLTRDIKMLYQQTHPEGDLDRYLLRLRSMNRGISSLKVAGMAGGEGE